MYKKTRKMLTSFMDAPDGPKTCLKKLEAMKNFEQKNQEKNQDSDFKNIGGQPG